MAVPDPRLVSALSRQSDVCRFWALTRISSASSCLWWVGALTNRGHGRFWLGQGRVIIAHRFAWAIAYGAESLDDAPVLSHACDNPLCLNVEHLRPSTPALNAREWALRHAHWAGPLSDPRGSRRRAQALRDGLRAGRPLAELLDEGRTELERRQLTLW